MDARKHAADQANRTIQLAYQAQAAAQQAAQAAQNAAAAAAQAGQAAQSILIATQDASISVAQGAAAPNSFSTTPWQ